MVRKTPFRDARVCRLSIIVHLRARRSFSVAVLERRVSMNQPDEVIRGNVENIPKRMLAIRLPVRFLFINVGVTSYG